MSIKSYYVILGVSPDEGPRGIRSAFRELAKRYHPDHGGPDTEERFREITEAYEVLSDPQQRRVYDRVLGRRNQEQEAPAIEVPRSSGTRRSRNWPPPEPLREEPAPAVREFIGPVFDAAYGWSGVADLEVLLSPEEARRGVILPILLPVVRRCLDCGGSARSPWFPCVGCAGTGLLAAEEEFLVELPARLASGTWVDVPVERWGVGYERRLRIRVEIRGA